MPIAKPPNPIDINSLFSFKL